MKDTLIINSISKIYFSIVSFFIFILLTLSVTYFFLNSGISFQNISFNSVRIDKLYIKWDEKLNIYIKELNISDDDSPSAFKIKPISIVEYLNKTIYIPMLTKSFIVEKLNYKDMSGSFKFKDKDGGNFKLTSENMVIDADIHSNQNYLNIELKQFENKDINLSISGNFLVDDQNKMLYLNSNISLKNDLSLNISAKSSAERLVYAINSNKSIPSTSNIVSLFDIDFKYWVDTAIDMKNLDIKQAYGFIEYKEIDNAYKNFYAYMVANELNYTYDQNLDSIKTEYTDLVFKDGTLYILPYESKTYSFGLDASWLNIDFTKPNTMLMLHLLFDGSVDTDLKNLLEHYKIKLPFIQNSGYMDTNLILNINLANSEVDAKGEFFTNEANFNYLGLDLDLTDTFVKLDNFDVEIPRMKAKYKDIAQSRLYGKLDLKNSKGYLSFDFSKIYFSDEFYLDSQEKHLKARYIIGSKKDEINIDSSDWFVLNKKSKLQKLEIPFNLDSLTAKIPTTELSSEDIHAYISGEADFNKSIYNLDLDLTKFNYSDIELDQSVVDLKLRYRDNELNISSSDSISLYHKKQKIKLENPSILYKDSSIRIDKTNMEFDNFFTSNFDFIYFFDSEEGFFSLNKFKFTNNDLQKMFNIDKKIDFKIKKANDQYMANASSLNMSAFSSDKEWVIAFNSLDKLKQFSPLLNKYNVDKGTFSIYKRTGEDNIRFLAKLDYKYKILSEYNKPVTKYVINGISHKDNKTYISINDKINIDIQNSNVSIKGSNVGIDINEVIKLVNDIDSKTKKGSSNYSLSAHFDKSYIYLSDTRRVISDTINLQYLNKITTAQLKYANGEAGFKYKNKKFHLYGTGFNDKFMENLFSMSKFNGGNLDFSVNGDTDDFSGVVFVKDTKIKEFKLLNNVLAFVNTIPSLVTFSLPSYNSKGLHAKTAYMMFTHKNHIYNVSDVYLESDELDILGHGALSIKDNFIDMELNLKTDLGSAASKIPVVGYILFNKDSISTTVKVDGKLDDPNIDSMLAKEIIVAPVNIIKRTLLLPFSIFSDD
ncbi:AsmA-like C-terminal domain-containing protein [Sulfurimonas sp.]|uniref:YhdP family protein n=1 Tax=Sulfurimonas sp. TaxID=2022749 RepID=UPI00356914CA